MYGDNYGYRSGLNQSMAATCAPRRGGFGYCLRPESGRPPILDIGSNDSTTPARTPRRLISWMDPTPQKFARYYPRAT
jgi:hypothetical protein